MKKHFRKTPKTTIKASTSGAPVTLTMQYVREGSETLRTVNIHGDSTLDALKKAQVFLLGGSNSSLEDLRAEIKAELDEEWLSVEDAIDVMSSPDGGTLAVEIKDQNGNVLLTTPWAAEQDEDIW